jgi:FlaG/FlaF family flagellin (archaellin)
MHNKRGITPLIATVLLIGLTIIIALIVYTFVTNFAENQIEDTENDADISLLCAKEVNLETTYCGINNDLTITLKNRGEVDFSDLSIFVDVLGTSESFQNQGQLISYIQKDFSITLSSTDISHITEIIIVPVITSGTNTGNCPEEIIEVIGSEIGFCGNCGNDELDIDEDCDLSTGNDDCTNQLCVNCECVSSCGNGDTEDWEDCDASDPTDSCTLAGNSCNACTSCIIT